MGNLFSTNNSSSSSWQAEGRNILITGASSGIGYELAKQFALKKANLALVARTDISTTIVKECYELGGSTIKVQSYKCDLTNNNDIKNMVENAVKDFKSFDVVILNAGRSMGHYFEEIKDIEQIDYMLKLNVNGAINTLHYLLPYIYKSNKSRIVFNSSISGIIPVPYRTIYCSSKFALTGFSGALRMELQDTYNDNAPKVCLINFPEVSGTKLNSSRLDFGAIEPPTQYKEDSKTKSNTLLTVEKACADMIREIERGTREWGHPLKASILRPLYSIIPSVIDNIIMKTVKKTHFRPIANQE